MLFVELKSSNDIYSEKLQSNKYNDEDMINLSWKIKEFDELNEIGRKLHAEIEHLSKNWAAAHGNRTDNTYS